MAPEAFKARLKELGLTQSKVAEVWGFSPDLVSRWATGKVPVPGWVGHALDGIKYGRLVKMSKDRGYPWPPVGYS